VTSSVLEGGKWCRTAGRLILSLTSAELVCDLRGRLRTVKRSYYRTVIHIVIVSMCIHRDQRLLVAKLVVAAVKSSA
jgi:hypothetical protein